MFRLRTLGQVDLRDSEGREVSAVLVQPKRLALLVYLAQTTAAGFQRRDLLLPMFWPDLPEERARNALRQALHQLRQALGKDIVLSRGIDALAVNGSRLWCDACAFDTALNRGDLDEALGVYGGDLLPGFAVEGAAEFDRWLDDTRTHLRERAVRAAWTLSEQHERTGQVPEAVASARRAAALAQDDEAGLRQLMALLDRVGDEAGVVEAYANFAHRLQRDFGEKPSGQTTALVETIRARPREGDRTSPANPAAPAATNGASPPRANGGPSSAGSRSTLTPVNGGTPARSNEFARTRGRERVTIAPFHNLGGDPALDFIGRLVCDAIAQGIVESRVVDVVTTERSEEPAQASGDTGILVSGSYFLSDERWCFQAKVAEPAGGRVLETIGNVTAPRERPWDAANELRRRVSGMLAGHLDPRFASWASAVAQAPNLEDHREFALGAELHLRGDFRAAIPHLLRAGSAREGFALPILWAVQASCNVEEWEQADAILAELTSPPHRARLSAFEKLGCDYLGACLGGQRLQALSIARRGAEMVPGSEVLSWLGREALFCNQPRAAVDALERLDPDRGWIPSWTPHWRRLTEAYHMLGDHTRELDAARRGRVHHPQAMSALMYEARALAALGDVTTLQTRIDEACASPPDRFADAGDVMLDAARELRAHGRPGDGVLLAEGASGWYEEQLREDEGTGKYRLALARALCERGRWEDAHSTVRSLLLRSPDNVDLIGFAGAIAGRIGEAGEARDAVTTLRTKTGRFRFGAQFVWIARILATLGDAEQAMTALRGGLARGYCYGVDLHTDIDLSLLGDHASFRELLRPK